MCVKACVYIHAMDNSGGVAVGGAYAKKAASLPNGFTDVQEILCKRWS